MWTFPTLALISLSQLVSWQVPLSRMGADQTGSRKTGAFLCAVLTALLSLSLFSAQPAAGLKVIWPPTLVNYTWDTPVYHWNRPYAKPLVGPLVSWDSVKSPEEFAGKIVLLNPDAKSGPAVESISYEEMFRRVQRYGPLAIIYGNPVAFHAGGTHTLTDETDHAWSSNVTLAEMGVIDGYTAQAIIMNLSIDYNISMWVNLTLDDRNVWMEYRRGTPMILWSIFFSALAAGATALSLMKLFAFIRRQGMKLSVAQLCLFLAFVCNLLRLIYAAIDPLWCGRHFLFPGAHVMSTITFPGNMITTLLISLYWGQMLQANAVKVAPFLTYMKWPFAVISVVIIALEFVISGLRATHSQSLTMVYVGSAVYFAVIFSISMIFFIFGGRVLRQLLVSRKLAGAGQKTVRKSLIKATALVIVCGFFNCVWLVGECLTFPWYIFFDVAGFHWAWTLIYLGMIGVSYSQVLSFKLPKGDSDFTSISSAKTHSRKIISPDSVSP